MKPLTILVAEDDLLSRMILERSIVQWGHQLVSTVDGEAAVRVLESRPVDVCIMDWEMPKLSGPEVCRWLRSSTVKNIPYTILITSKNKPEDVQEGYEAGADDYLIKPCDLKYLRRRIATVQERLNWQYEEQEKARNSVPEEFPGLSPLDVYLSNLRLARRKI